MVTCVARVVTVWEAMFAVRRQGIAQGDVLRDGKEICVCNVIPIVVNDPYPKLSYQCPIYHN